jgi:hypothetical protein
MAEQQDSAPAHADLEQSRCFVLDIHNVAAYGGKHPPPGSRQFGIGRHLQDDSTAVFHAPLMCSRAMAFDGSLFALASMATRSRCGRNTNLVEQPIWLPATGEPKR